VRGYVDCCLVVVVVVMWWQTLVRALVLTLDTFEELSRDPDPEVTKRMHSLEARYM